MGLVFVNTNPNDRFGVNVKILFVMQYKVKKKREMNLTEQQKKHLSIVEKWLGIVIWSFLLIIVIWGINYNSSLSKNGKTTVGVVIEIEKAGKTDTFDYEYSVNIRRL